MDEVVLDLTPTRGYPCLLVLLKLRLTARSLFLIEVEIFLLVVLISLLRISVVIDGRALGMIEEHRRLLVCPAAPASQSPAHVLGSPTPKHLANVLLGFLAEETEENFLIHRGELLLVEEERLHCLGHDLIGSSHLHFDVLVGQL